MRVLEGRELCSSRVPLEFHAKVRPILDPSKLWRARDLKFAAFRVPQNLRLGMSLDGSKIRSSSFVEFVLIFVLKFVETWTCKSSIVQKFIFSKRVGALEG